VLQKAITTSKDNKLTLSEVEKVTGAPKSALINEVVLALNQKEAEKGLRAIRTAVEEGIDMKIFTRMLIQKIRIILLIRSASGFAAVIKDDVSETDYSMLKKIADETVSPINSKTILELLNALDLTGKSYIDELPLELAVIRLTGAEK
jgi:DNA polymerase-3 subunit gamma/tau